MKRGLYLIIITLLMLFATTGYCADQNIYIDDNAPRGDGQSVPIEFEPPTCKYLKLKATETGGANPITPTVILVIQ